MHHSIFRGARKTDHDHGFRENLLVTGHPTAEIRRVRDRQSNGCAISRQSSTGLTVTHLGMIRLAAEQPITGRTPAPEPAAMRSAVPARGATLPAPVHVGVPP
jgi:hypothetical protein